MKEFIIYLIKSGVCLTIFLIIYKLFLRSNTFFRFNRYYLIFGLIASLIIPAIRYTYDVKIAVPLMATQHVDAVATAQSLTPTPISGWMIAFGVYIMGTILLLIRNLLAYRNLIKLVKSGVQSSSKGYKLVDSNKIQSPFTVLNYILLNMSKLSETEKDLILKHEKTHISQKHWIDLLGSECMLLLQWFNPLAWFYVSLQKENHEFLADKAVIDSGTKPALYQAVLINQRFQGPVFSFANSFNYSNQLNRLTMIKKVKSSPWKRMTVLTIIPILGVYLWASAEPRYVIEQMNIPEGIVETAAENNKDTISNDTKKKKVSVIGFKSTEDGGISVIGLKSESESESKSNGNTDIDFIIIDGEEKTLSDMKNLDTNSIDNISVLKNGAAAEKLYGEKGKNGVIIVNTKNNSVKHTSTGGPEIILSAQEVTVADSSEMTLSAQEVTVHNTSTSGKIGQISVRKADNVGNPLLIVDGKEPPFETLKDITPDKIEKIEVLKGKAATDKYGEKGKNGVIIITTKK